ncbi:MAG: ABC-2 transporter permease [Clostridia bacterium]|nr:ABC-2 transporter permease [Clostridia bacterium]
MKELLKKEAFFTAPKLTWIFLAFAVMALIPGYPILTGAFYICFGLFQSYQTAREANDILYTAMLPVKKTAVVRAKFAFACLIEGIAFVLSSALTALRMTLLAHAAPYETNAMMNANVAFLGYMLLAFALFNLFFIGGFFKTAHKIGRPFLTYGIAVLLLVAVAEALHFLPGLTPLNATTFDPLQLVPFAVGAVAYPLLTVCAEKTAEKRFEKLDL